jgi:hypothetical protein
MARKAAAEVNFVIAADRFANHIRRIRHRVCHWLCADLLWNSDMSVVIDQLLQENEHLRHELQERSHDR